MACLHESADSKLSSQPHSVVILSGAGALVSVCFHCMTAQTFCVCEQVSLQLAQRPDRNTGLTCSQSTACQAAGHAALRCLLAIGTCRRCNKQIQQTASEWKARQGDASAVCAAGQQAAAGGGISGGAACRRGAVRCCACRRCCRRCARGARHSPAGTARLPLCVQCTCCGLRAGSAWYVVATTGFCPKPACPRSLQGSLPANNQTAIADRTSTFQTFSDLAADLCRPERI